MTKAVRTTLVLTLAVICWGCGSAGKLDAVPAELIGVWYSNHPYYAGRYFELRPKAVVFGTGGESFTEHEIVSIRRTVESYQTVYEVTYHNEGTEDSWTFFYYSDHSIQFQNQLGVPWSKDFPATEDPAAPDEP